MIQDEAQRIEQAAYIMLHVVIAAGFGSEHAQAYTKHFPPGTHHYTMRRARQLLEWTPAWTEAGEKGGA
jgi:hypothetical protein